MFAVGGPGKSTSHAIRRTEGAWDGQDFIEFDEGGKVLVSVLCTHDARSFGNHACAMHGPGRTLITKEIHGGTRVAAFPSVVKTIDEARKLVHAIAGNPSGWKDSKEYKRLMGQL